MTVLYTTFLNIKVQIKHSERVFYNCHTAHVTGRLSQTTYNLAAFNGLNRIIYNSYYSLSQAICTWVVFAKFLLHNTTSQLYITRQKLYMQQKSVSELLHINNVRH